MQSLANLSKTSNILDTKSTMNTFPRYYAPNANSPPQHTHPSQVKFYEVSEDELVKLRDQFKHGQLTLQIEDGVFSMKEQNALEAEVAHELPEIRKKQRAAQAEQLKLDAESLARLKAQG